MQLSIISSILAFTALVSAAPAELSKRDTCTMVGYYSSTMVVGGGGPGQAPVFQYRYFISINYVGGQNIKGSIPGANPIANGGQTFNPQDTNLPNPIHWQAHTNGLPNIWNGCSVDYEGHTYQGYLVHPHEGPGQTISECHVDFSCEGNLHSS